MRTLAELSLRHPRPVLAALGVATALLGAGALRLEAEAGYRAFLGRDHPAIRALDAFAARFGGGLPFAAIWSCAESSACESVFDPGSLRMAWQLARAVEAVPGVRRVDGPATSPLLVQDFGLPTARRLAPEGRPARDLEALAARARVDPTWVGQLVSADGSAGALVVHLEDSESETGVRALAVLRDRLAEYEARGFVFHLVGGPVEFVVAGDELARNAARLVPVMVLLIGLGLVGLFRSWLAAALALGSVGAAVLWTLGLQGWLGWPQNSLGQALAPLVLVIGVCDAIHLLAGYASRVAAAPAARGEREAALLAVVAQVGPPCFLTTATTAAGFASFAASGLESLARFGWVAAFGIAAALVLCFTLLPILTVRVDTRRLGGAAPAGSWERGLERLAGLALRHPRRLLAAAAVLTGLGAWGVGSLRVDARFEDLYGENSQVVRWARAASRHLREPETLEIAVAVPPGERWDSAEALRVLERIEGLGDLDGLDRPLSILVPLRELHRLMHRRELALDGSEASGERARSMLRLLALEDPSLLELFVERESGALRVSLQAGKHPQERLRELLAEVRRQLGDALPPGWTAQVTGPLATVAVMIDEIRETQLTSFGLCGVLVLALIAAFFRSPALAGLALVPTGLPVLVTLGAMGLLGVALDVGSAMVAAVVLGLAVDNAIHLLSAYRRRRRGGEPAELAISASVRQVGRALVTSALALSLGFFSLALVPWQSIASFGLVSGIAILGALLAALLVLPALVVATARRDR